jgi:hypothetical protein
VIVPYTELPRAAGNWPRPLLDVSFGDVEDVLVPCLVDSGAVHTLVPAWVAADSGVGLDQAPPVAFGIGGGSTRARFATVRLAADRYAWDAEVGFCDPWPYSWGLLGHASFFRYFTVTFRAADGEFELLPIAR